MDAGSEHELGVSSPPLEEGAEPALGQRVKPPNDALQIGEVCGIGVADDHEMVASDLDLIEVFQEMRRGDALRSQPVPSRGSFRRPRPARPRRRAES